jgi:cytochrome c5
VVALALAIPVALGAAEAFGQAPDGKQVFLGQKCNMCHSVKAAGIEATMKKAVDLPGGADKTQLKDYLQQKTEINGKKHPKKVTASDAELTAVIDWVGNQKK